MYYEVDYGFWIKFVVLFIIIVIFPVWFFKLVDISFLYKVMFTFAGSIGLWFALKGRTIGRSHGFGGRR